MKYSILKWVGPSDYKSLIGALSWDECFVTEDKEEAKQEMEKLVWKGVKACLYENGILVSTNYANG